MSARGVYGISWVKARVWDETHDPEKSQGWCPAILDYNGDGKITKPWTTADQPADPKLDRMIPGPTGYIIAVSPTDGSVWFHTTDLIPGRIVRMEVGAHPPETCMAEKYEPPFSVKNQDGYWPARNRRGFERYRLGGTHRQRATGEFRPAQVQGKERPDGDGAALPRRMDSLSRARPAIQGKRRGRRTISTTIGWTAPTRSAWATTCRL